MTVAFLQTSRLLERPVLSPTPSRHSFVHQDGGRVILDAKGQVQQSPRLSTEQQPSSERRWDPSEMEKQRLYTEARRNAALTQLSGGADLEPMGMSDDVPHEPPPEYSPQSAAQLRFVVDPPTDFPKEKAGFRPEMSSASSPAVSAPPADELSAVGEPASPLSRDHPAGHDSTRSDGRNESIMPESFGNSNAGPSTKPRQSIQPLSDKDQMKRYYEAQARIAQNSGPPELKEAAQVPPPVAAKPSQGSHQPISDKEAMRRFYEAQDQMAPAQALLQAGSGSQTKNHTEHGNPGGSISSPAPLEIAPRFMSATEEKDVMKRRYEQASRQVSDHHTRRGESENDHAVSSDVTSTRADYSPAPALGSGSSQGHSQWPSAEDEKEAMKRRYDDAVRAMGQTSMDPGFPGPVDASSMEAGPAGPSQWQNEQEGLPQSQLNDFTAHPPPLPARPNEEYKKLLSPDLMQGMPLMPMANPYLYGNHMMSPPFGMPISPTYGGQQYPVPMAPMFGMGKGMMPNLPANPYVYNMPPGQASYSGAYQSPTISEHPQGEGSGSSWNENPQERHY